MSWPADHFSVGMGSHLYITCDVCMLEHGTLTFKVPATALARVCVIDD